MKTPATQSASREEQPVLDRGLVLLVLALVGLLAVRLIGSPDAGFHLATGRSILAGQGWPRTDTFTYTVRDHAYVDTSWGYDVLVAAIESGFGAAGLVLLHAAFAVATFAIVYRTACLGPSGRWGVVLLLLGALMSEERFEVRPELASYVLLALVLHILQRHSEKADDRLWPLLPLFLVWSNVHALYVVGWTVLGCFVLGSWIRDRTLDRRLLAWSLACVAAGLVNPYGWRGVGMSLALATRLGSQHVFHRHIAEYESPMTTVVSGDVGFYLVPIGCLFVFLLLTAVSVPRLWRTGRPSAALLVLVFVPLALAMVRNAPFLAVACLPGTAWALHARRGRAASGMRRRSHRVAVAAVRSGVAIVAVLVGLRVRTDAYYVDHGRVDRFGWGWNRYRLPVEAADWVRAQPGLAGTMLNDYDYGGHLTWAVEQPVFIDGRNEVMGETFFEYYASVFTSPEAWEECVARWGIGWTIFPYRRRPELLQRLSADPRWNLAYADHDAVVFARAGAGSPTSGSGAVMPTRPSVSLDRLPGLGGPERASRLQRWLEGLFRERTYPVEAYSRGVFEYLRGDWGGLAAWSAEAIRLSGGSYPEHYGNLGSALYALGDLETARRCLDIAVAETPWYRRAARHELRSVRAQVDDELRRSR